MNFDEQKELRLVYRPVWDPRTSEYVYAVPSSHDGAISFVPVEKFLHQLCLLLEKPYGSFGDRRRVERVVIEWDSVIGSRRRVQDRLLGCIGALPYIQSVHIMGQRRQHSNQENEMHPLKIFASSLVALLQNCTGRLVELNISIYRLVEFENFDEVQRLAHVLRLHATLQRLCLGTVSLKRNAPFEPGSRIEVPGRESLPGLYSSVGHTVSSSEMTSFWNNNSSFWLDPLILALCSLPNNLRHFSIQGPPLLTSLYSSSNISASSLASLLRHVKESVVLQRLRFDETHAAVICNFLAESNPKVTLNRMNLLGNFLTRQLHTGKYTNRDYPLTSISSDMIKAMSCNFTMKDFKMDGLNQQHRRERDRILCLNKAGRQRLYTPQSWIHYLACLQQPISNPPCHCPSCHPNPCILCDESVLLTSIFEAVRAHPDHVLSHRTDNHKCSVSSTSKPERLELKGGMKSLDKLPVPCEQITLMGAMRANWRLRRQNRHHGST